MIRKALSLLFAAWSVCLAQGQQASSTLTNSDGSMNATSPGEYCVTDRGPHHRVWSSVSFVTNRIGNVVVHTNATYTELSTGMHYFSDGEWKESSPSFIINSNGYAFANRAQHQVTVAPNLNSSGAVVDLVTPGGKHLRSAILGLNLFDPGSGKSQQIAAVKDSVGQQTAPNEITFFDAFTGLKADVRIRNELGKFHQEVLLREQITREQISALGFDADGARLETWTEFLEAPEPTVQAVASSKAQMTTKVRAAEAEIVDQSLDFGAFQMVQGKSFVDGAEGNSMAVCKEWMKLQGKTYLVEAAACASLSRLATNLPVTTNAAITKRKSSHLIAGRIPPKRNPHNGSSSHELAKLERSADNPPVVLDYVAVNTTQTNFTFKCDTTYYLTNVVSLYGTAVFEGGAVLKFGRIGLYGRGQLALYATNIVSRTAAYRPVILTSKDDNAVGEVIPGSTGNPLATGPGTGLYGDDAGAISLPYWTALTNFHFLYLNTALVVNSGVVLYDAQFVHCGSAAYQSGSNAGIAVYNGLFCNTIYCFVIPSGTLAINVVGQNITAYNCVLLSIPDGHTLDEYDYEIALANSLFVNASVDDGVSLNHCASIGGGSSIFQSVGGAGLYLADDTYRNAGTTSIDPYLLSSLKNKTTFPPMVYSNVTFITNVTFQPQANRDTDTPDLGYHYDPLDVVCYMVRISNSIVRLLPGTAVGTAGNPGQYGIALWQGSQLISEGTANNLNHIVRYNAAQECSTTNWSGVAASILGGWLSGAAPQVSFRFTDFSVLGGGNGGERHFLNSSYRVVASFSDCQFHGGRVEEGLPNFYVTNCLFERVYTVVDDSSNGYDVSPVFRNCLFYGGTLSLMHWNADTWSFRDNLLDQTALSLDIEGSGLDGAYNGYTTGSARLTTNINDVVAGLVYQSSRLGDYYQPTNSAFINKGSTTADLVGLFHYTTQMSQTLEANSPVDIGFHYMATDANGNPIDTDGNGVPDYVSDANGNGTIELGETPFGITIENPVNGTIIR